QLLAGAAGHQLRGAGRADHRRLPRSRPRPAAAAGRRRRACRDPGAEPRGAGARGAAMATHFWEPLHLMLEIVPLMRRRGFGRIVNISSIGGRMAVPHLAPYSARLTTLSDNAARANNEL